MAKKPSGASASEMATGNTSGFPLFFTAPKPLELVRHGKAGLLPTPDVSFAATTNSILINGVEFVEAAKHYPIVFTQTELPLPVAVVGLEQQNYFLDAKGHWQAESYIPAYVRKYPFIFMEVPESREFVLCIDESASQYHEKVGKAAQALYEGSEPSAMTRNALEFCTAFHNHYVITRQFCTALKAAGVLMPVRSDAKLFNGREIHLSGFQAIDEKKLNALSDEKIIDFHKKGWLPLIYFALMSSSNWKKLVDMAGERESTDRSLDRKGENRL